MLLWIIAMIIVSLAVAQNRELEMHIVLSAIHGKKIKREKKNKETKKERKKRRLDVNKFSSSFYFFFSPQIQSVVWNLFYCCSLHIHYTSHTRMHTLIVSLSLTHICIQRHSHLSKASDQADKFSRLFAQHRSATETWINCTNGKKIISTSLFSWLKITIIYYLIKN